jgi:hypothetical protein
MAVLTLLLALLAGLGSPARAADPPLIWGFADNTYRDPGAMDRKFAEMVAVGGTMVRMDFDAVDVDHDRAVANAQARGLRILGVLYGDGWSRKAADYARRVETIVQAYGGAVDAWEIWNEPNLRYFWSGTRNAKKAAGQYTELVKAAYPVIKRVDPTSTVLAGSLSRNDAKDGRPNDWMYFMYQFGAKGFFDAISVHPYTIPDSPALLPGGQPTYYNQSWYQMAGPWNDATGRRSVREQMVAQGDGAKRIWITEWSMPTRATYSGQTIVTPQQQGAAAADAFRLAKGYPWLGAFLWYQLRDDIDGEGFGIMYQDFSHKPSWDAYRAAATTP